MMKKRIALMSIKVSEKAIIKLSAEQKVYLETVQDEDANNFPSYCRRHVL
jgi:hypothetical protein